MGKLAYVSVLSNGRIRVSLFGRNRMHAASTVILGSWPEVISYLTGCVDHFQWWRVSTGIGFAA